MTAAREAPNGLGALAAALAKAQGEFATVTRSKTVVVQKKAGGSYTFAYAPLDTILDAVRAPLAKNGLAMVQLLDTEALVTMLVHDSGASLEARTPVPPTTDIQAYGSAITYLRRYAIQALLGIAAEEDDDGNRGAGNEAAPVHSGESVELMSIDTVTGVVAKGGADKYQAEWRETPSGHVIGFALKRKDDKDFPQVGVMGDIGETLYLSKTELLGQKVTLKGRFYAVRQSGRTGYTRVIVGQGPGDYIETDDWRIPPAPEANPEGEPVPGQVEAFDAAESARVDAEEVAAS